MIAQPVHLLDRFLLHVCAKLRIVRRNRAAKHEVLPDHQTQPVALVVEVIALVVAAAPQPHHVHVCVACRFENAAMFFRRHTIGKAVERDHIRAFGEDRHAVHLEAKTLAPLVLVAQQPHGAQTGSALRRQGLAADLHLRRNLVEILRPVSHRPPSLRMLDDNWHMHGIAARHKLRRQPPEERRARPSVSYMSPTTVAFVVRRRFHSSPGHPAMPHPRSPSSGSRAAYPVVRRPTSPAAPAAISPLSHSAGPSPTHTGTQLCG